jgi:hypothetical protein
MERRVASDILLNAFHERYSPFEKCAVKFSTVARIVRAESMGQRISPVGKLSFKRIA